jgi:hypothetical protein
MVNRTYTIRRDPPQPAFPQRETVSDRLASNSSRSFPGVVAGMYALPASEGTRFYKVGVPDKGKWVGWIFLSALSGSPGYWRTTPIKATAHKTSVLNAIAANPSRAAQLFGRKYQICGRCSSPLTDPRSRAAGYGATCAEKLGWHYPTDAEALAFLGETANN